jgi:hypothetical protein
MSEPVAPEPTMPEPIPPAVSAEPKPEVGASWTPRVTFLPDPTRGGAPGAGLSGTVLLPAGGCGTLTVELADDTPPVYGRRPAVVERWQFDKGTLGKLRTDAGYALFLPWSGYSPDVTRVRLAVRFDSEDGNTLLLPAAAVALARPEPVAAPTPQMAEPAKPELQPRTDAAPPVKPGKKPKKAKPADPLVRVQSVIDQSEDLRRVREEVATRAADYRQLFNFGSGLFGSQ